MKHLGWAQDDPPLWKRCVATTCLHHLRSCTLVDANTKDRANQEMIEKNSGRTTANRQHAPQAPTPYFSHMQPHLLQFMPQPGSSTGTQLYNMPTASTSSSGFYDPYDPSERSTSPIPSIAPSDSISHSGALSRAPSVGHIFSRPVSARGSTIELPKWSSAKQTSFERRLARLTASAGLPFSWLENIEWLLFVDEFIPAARSPSRKVLY